MNRVAFLEHAARVHFQQCIYLPCIVSLEPVRSTHFCHRIQQDPHIYIMSKLLYDECLSYQICIQALKPSGVSATEQARKQEGERKTQLLDHWPHSPLYPSNTRALCKQKQSHVIDSIAHAPTAISPQANAARNAIKTQEEKR